MFGYNYMFDPQGILNEDPNLDLNTARLCPIDNPKNDKLTILRPVDDLINGANIPACKKFHVKPTRPHRRGVGETMDLRFSRRWCRVF